MTESAITFACACGKMLRVDASYGGRQGRCPSCREALVVPVQTGQARPPGLNAAIKSAPADPPKVAEKRLVPAREICGICQSPLHGLEERTRCRDCDLFFHSDCWRENFGC